MEESVPLVLRHSYEQDYYDDEGEFLLYSRSEVEGMSSSVNRQTWWQRLCAFGSSIALCCCRRQELKPRMIHLGESYQRYPPNVIRNQKYNIFTFLPKVLFEQFKIFLNLYFLIMAITQFVPDIRIGYLYTYWGPLGFVISVTVIREAVNDFRRYRRDKEVNAEKYKRLMPCGEYEWVPSSQIQVGDLLCVEKNQRVPADLVLLRTSEATGEPDNFTILFF